MREVPLSESIVLSYESLRPSWPFLTDGSTRDPRFFLVPLPNSMRDNLTIDPREAKPEPNEMPQMVPMR